MTVLPHILRLILFSYCVQERNKEEEKREKRSFIISSPHNPCFGNGTHTNELTTLAFGIAGKWEFVHITFPFGKSNKTGRITYVTNICFLRKSYTNFAVLLFAHGKCVCVCFILLFFFFTFLCLSLLFIFSTSQKFEPIVPFRQILFQLMLRLVCFFYGRPTLSMDLWVSFVCVCALGKPLLVGWIWTSTPNWLPVIKLIQCFELQIYPISVVLMRRNVHI